MASGLRIEDRRFRRQIDEAGNSFVLNIDEINGRYAELDHHRLLSIAQSASIRVAVCLDLAEQQGLLAENNVQRGKERLWRISAMLAGF